MEPSDPVACFDFLASEHGFVRSEAVSETARITTFRSSDLVIEFEIAGDGYGARIGFPGLGATKIHVGTLLGAMETARPNRQPGLLGTSMQHAAFIKDNLERLRGMTLDLYRDCVALRFWHAADWRSVWGRTMRLTPEAIRAERARLVRLQGYFVARPHRLP